MIEDGMNKTAKTSVIILLVLSLIASWTEQTEAATIERHVDPIMGCAVRVSGQVVEGDAERLRQILAAIESDEERWTHGQHGFRICFDSPGGSFVEGARIARVIGELNFGTAIPAGARCESACAIAFMAGTGRFMYDEEMSDEVFVNRVLHPQGVLGFHAPNLIVSEGQYNEQEVNRAYQVALNSVSLILDLMGGRNYIFPVQLLRDMLATPPGQMLRLTTVEQAQQWGVNVAPTRFSGISVPALIENLCGDESLQNAEHASRIGFEVESSDEFQYGEYTATTIRITTGEGFGMDAVNRCILFLSIPESQYYLRAQMAGRRLSEMRTRPQVNYVNYEPMWPTAFATYPPRTLISTLPEPNFDIDTRFLLSLLRNEGRRLNFGSCWLTIPTARITNVNEYVNLRRQPDFSAPVIRQVPLGEGVRPLRFDNITVIGQERDRQSCINACQAFGRNAEDRAARDRAQQCIQDNMIWYEITDARGNRGWVSRRYLEEAR